MLKSQKNHFLVYGWSLGRAGSLGSWGLFGGFQETKIQSLRPLSLGPSGRPWRLGGPGLDQADNSWNSNVIFHSHLVLISIVVMFTMDGALCCEM